MIGTTTLLNISTLGRFEIHRDHALLAGGNWSRRKVCDLFKLLLSADQHRLHREQIQELLWPTSTIEQAANSFGKTLYLLRRALEPDLVAGKGSSSVYVLLEHDTLMLLPSSMEIDADRFEAAARQLQATLRSRSSRGPDRQSDLRLLEEFDGVLALYKGDYLPEDLYEDWAQRRRDRLCRVYSWLLENAAQLALEQSQSQRACEYLQALVERNSADEQTHRQLMLVYARMGRRSDALNQYQLLREALRTELDAQPLPETTELFRKIQAGRITVDLVETEDASGSSQVSSRRDDGAQSPAHKQNGEDTATEPATQSQLDPERILKAELVGRDEVIVTLQHSYNKVQNGGRKAIFISGEPGIGKTRLARELARWAEETRQATVLWGYCYEMSGTFPYQPIAEAIGTYIRTCNPERLRAMLGGSAVDLAKIAPEVRAVLPDLPKPEPSGPELERRNLYSAVARFFQALAAQHPLIIVLDDVQWADAATMQLLNFLTAQSTGAGIFGTSEPAGKRSVLPFYLMLYRAEEVNAAHPLRGLMTTLTRSGISEDIRLQRLSEEEVHQLLMNMAGHSVRPIFAAEIYKQTEGNPFFVGEAIRSLALEGKIKRMGDHWQATVDVNKLEIPHSVRLVIERRLAHLSPECRTTLAVAAVLGRKFSSELLCQARHLSDDIVAEHIDEAIQAQLLSTLPDALSGGTVFTPTDAHSLHERDLDLNFTHDKIREVLYQWLNPLRRRALHRQVAQAIEARYATHLQPYYSTLAYHYQMAEKFPQAVDYLLKAAHHAASVYAFVNTAEYMQDALDLLISDEERAERAELLGQLSQIYIYTGRPDKAIEAGMGAATLWRDLGNNVKQAEAYLDVSFCCHWMGRELDAVEHIQRALHCIENRPEETRLLAKTYVQWGLAATVMGDPLLAREKLQQADSLHAGIGGKDPFISVVSLWAWSWYAFLTETPLRMLEYALRGIEACNSLNKPEWLPMMSYTAAWAYMQLGQLDKGQGMAHEAHRKAQQYGVVGAQGWTNLVESFLAIQAGQWEEANKKADGAYAIATMLHDADLQARVLWSRSVCAGWRSDWESAIVNIEEAMRTAQLAGETSMFFPYLLVQAAKAYFFAGKPADAQIYLDQAMQLGRSRHYRQLPATGLRLQGRIWQAQSRFTEAQSCFERSLTELAAVDDRVEYARTEEAYGDFYLQRQDERDEERGQALLRSARETFQRLGVNG